MNSFPFMKVIEGKNCLLIGGGNVALRKAEKLLLFGADITVCAEEFRADFSALPLKLLRRRYDASLLEGMDFVFAATDDGQLNAQVAKECRERKIPVNCADDPKHCDFFFPALICRGDLTIGITTGGASPALAAVVREYLESVLPSGMEKIEKECARLRKEKRGAEYVEAVHALFYGALDKESGK